ncbi:MAG: hypothetical protein LBF44_03425 [Holosporaceae bacterium]|nr:hypothetical protein [Holosporaceae bacterium]
MIYNKIIKMIKKFPSKRSIIFYYNIMGSTSKKAHLGVILIEFALAIPILIAFLYYVHDLPKYERIQSKMQFCSHCAVNMIQNVTSGRANKAVTKKDMSYIFPITMLPYWGSGTRQYGTSHSRLASGYYGFGILYYVKGVGSNKAKIIWALSANDDGKPPGTGNPLFSTSTIPYSPIQVDFNVEYNSEYILPGLTIKAGEVKMLYETMIWSISGVKKPDGTVIWSGGSPSPSLFGLYLIMPKKVIDFKNYYNCFRTVTIFTPRPGLFFENSPQLNY